MLRPNLKHNEHSVPFKSISVVLKPVSHREWAKAEIRQEKAPGHAQEPWLTKKSIKLETILHGDLACKESSFQNWSLHNVSFSQNLSLF